MLMNQDEENQIVSTWLTPDLQTGSQPLEPGTEVAIVSRWHEFDYYYVELDCPGSTEHLEYSLMWLLQLGLEAFAILGYPPPIRAELFEPIYFVLKVVEPGTLQVISKERLERISAACVNECSRVPRTESGVVEMVLGKFPTWEDYQASLPCPASKSSADLSCQSLQPGLQLRLASGYARLDCAELAVCYVSNF